MARKLKGIRRHGRGWQIYGKARGVPFCEQFPISATPAEMAARRLELRRDLLKRQPTTTPGTLAADILKRYLPTLADRPGLQRDRARQLAWWAARLGHRRRSAIRREEWIAALADLAATPMRRGQLPSASTRKKYRTAMFHLFTTLDGKDAPNPFRDIPPPREPDPEPRWIPYAIIDALFRAMPDRRFRGTLTSADVLTIRTRARQPGANASLIARDHAISEAMVRKIRAGRWTGRREDRAQSKARLKAMAFVGLTPAQLALFQPETDVNWQEPSLLIHGRQKGQGGGRTKRVPLIPEGVQALRELIAAGAIGPFSESSVIRVFHRAIETMVGELARLDWRLARTVFYQLQTMRARPYDLRHSYLTEAQLAGGDIKATQELATHSDIRQTMRYTLAAVDPNLKALADQISARFAGRVGLGRTSQG